ncbi:MAG TPA: 2-hydroxyacid dehydrogenase [Nitrososphaerales archaeon]|nr:2-hydroxyacid dehydrogenase [Nitrososphaerales archaeon]
MTEKRPKLLVAQTPNPREDFEPLRRYADICWLDEMDERERGRVLPQVEVVYSHGWPKALDEEAVSSMRRLRLFQAGNAGVNGMRFDLLGRDVVLCSNAGGYSDEVAEFAIGMMLAAGKSIVKFDRQIRSRTYVRMGLDELGRRVTFFKGKTLGVVGYGGIGRSTARLAKALGMEVIAFGRHRVMEKGVELVRGRRGLSRLLRNSDAVVLAVPLTKATRGLIGREELSSMRPTAILVNVARGQVVEKEAVYRHLVENPSFTFATDVWWPEGGVESFDPDLPFNELENFLGTPHASGPSAIITGSVAEGAIGNLLRYFKGEPLRNVVDKSEYV